MMNIVEMSTDKTDLGARAALDGSEFVTEKHNNEVSVSSEFIRENVMDEESNPGPTAVAHKKLRREHLEIETELESKLRRCDETPDSSLDEHKYSLFPCQAPGCIEHFETIKKYDDHYHAKHWHVCGECKKTYPTEHLLGLHVQECHDMFFKVKSEKQPMFECYLQVCALKFNTPDERFKHCVNDHKFPQTFLHSTSKRDYYPKPKQPKKKRNTKEKPTKVEAHDETEMEATECSTEEAMETTSITSKEKGSISGMQTRTQTKQKKPISQQEKANPKNLGTAKNPGMHIQFGHTSAARFVPRFTFAMSKENVGKKKEGGVEADMNLTQVKAALDNVEGTVHEVQVSEVNIAKVKDEKT